MTRRRAQSNLELAFDASLCDGHGMCSLVFPEGISLDQWGYAVVDQEPFSDRRLRRRARAAAGCCPAGALSIVAGPISEDAVGLSGSRRPTAGEDTFGQE